MATKLLLYSVLLVIFYQNPTQESDVGIFLTTEQRKNCQNVRFTRNKKIKVCTPSNPIIISEDFVSVTDIINDEARSISYFNLKFSQRGYDKIKGVISQFAGIELVLIVDNTVVGFIKNTDQIVNKSLQIDGPLHSDEVTWVYERLQKATQYKK
jgi:hypothetical protein